MGLWGGRIGLDREAEGTIVFPMALRRYGVLRAKVMDRRHAVPENPHYQIRAHDGELDWRVSVNVRSQDRSDLRVYVDDDFSHPILDGLLELAPGWHHLTTRPGGLALDYIRGNLVDPNQMRQMPFFLPGPSNDLNELFDSLMSRQRADREAGLFAFGERWGPESFPDKIYGFTPGNGVHDVHMNQGNEKRRSGSDGVYQDGALLFHYPGADRWVAVFLAFQSQSWHTDDRTGHRVSGPQSGAHGAKGRRMHAMESWDSEEASQAGPGVLDGEPPLRVVDAGEVRIVAYVPPDGVGGRARVILLNVSPKPVALENWALLDEAKQRHELRGILEAGSTRAFELPHGFGLVAGRGGTLTVIDGEGMRVDGVRCGRGDLARDGWAVVF
jgi:uncharacterized protein YukJ